MTATARADVDDAEADRGAPPGAFGAERLPAFPVKALPEPFAGWAEAVAEAHQVPLDLPGMAALAVVAAAVSGKLDVEIRAGFVETLNTYVIVEAESGARKSAVVREAVGSLHAFEIEENARTADARRAADDDREVAEALVEAALKGRKTQKDPNARADAKAEHSAALGALDALPRPRPPLRLLADDVTPERLVGLLAEQDGRLAILSAEGGLLGSVLGKRYAANGGSHVDPLLKAHGGEPIRVDRVGRPPVYVARPTLTLALFVQREILRGLAADASLRGVGFLARFLYALPASMVGSRRIAAPPVHDDVRRQYADAVVALLRLPLNLDDRGDPVPRRIRFTADADQALREFEAALEPRLAEDGDLAGIGDWAGKLVGAVARVAALRTLAGSTYGIAAGRGEPREVPRADVDHAITFGHYAIEHALAAFAAMGSAPEQEIARRLAGWIARKELREFSERDALRALCGGRASVTEAADLIEPLAILRDRGFIVLAEDVAVRRLGRPHSPTWLVNPAVHARGIASVPSERTRENER